MHGAEEARFAEPRDQFARTVKPGKLSTADGIASPIDQNSIFGGGKDTSSSVGQSLNLLGYGNGVPHGRQTAGVKRLSHQRALTQEEQIPLGVDRIKRRLGQNLGIAPVGIDRS